MIEIELNGVVVISRCRKGIVIKSSKVEATSLKPGQHTDTPINLSPNYYIYANANDVDSIHNFLEYPIFIFIFKSRKETCS